jgi:hypothetical protein
MINVVADGVALVRLSAAAAPRVDDIALVPASHVAA